MAQVARAQTEPAGGPEHLERLSVQFRGMGVPEQEVIVSGTVRELADGRAVVLDTVAEQGGKQIIRNAEAELEAIAAAPRFSGASTPPTIKSHAEPPVRSAFCARWSRTTCAPANRSPRDR